MSRLKDALQSTVGRKYLVAAMGWLFFGFLLTHLVANLTLLLPDDGASFNAYAAGLAALGPGLYVLEIGLLAVFLLHAGVAMSTVMANRSARRTRYAVDANAGGPSRKGFASMTMRIGGPLILVFVVWHLITLKWGPVYETKLDGHMVRDLNRTVVEFFQNPIYVGLYVLMMGVIFLHLKHGLWSGLQSLGLHHPRFTPMLQKASFAIAALMAGGFALIPIGIYIREVLL